MKKRKLTTVIFIVGFLLCVFPIAANVPAARHHADAISTYQKNTKKMGSKFSEMLEETKKYNDMLFQSQGAAVDNMETGILSDKNYNGLLAVSGAGIMGSLDIPKINVKLPLYHGTGEDALSGGVGHLRGTSLPVGGENTHCVITGHRGLPNAKLLVRLDEMKEGDLMYLHVGEETLAYKVSETKVIEPDELSCLNIDAGEDKLSVVTCTPYGINTQRLVVTGNRVKYQKSDYDKIKAAFPSAREITFTIFPVIFAVVSAVMLIKERRRSDYEKKY